MPTNLDSIWLKKPFRKIYIRHFEKPAQRTARQLAEWEAAGRPAPPPHTVKQEIILQYAKEFQTPVFVETGTFEGDMVEAMRTRFERLYSIELMQEHYQRAVQRFSRHDHIQLFHGDSARMIKGVLESIDSPALFWLDGHFSGDGTAKADKETPIVEEIQTIAGHPKFPQHVILVDDARCFDGTCDYPTLEGMQKLATELGYSQFSVNCDIIRIHN